MSGREAKAFTLVELLVVVAIIALLITILMPSLGRAMELARRATCATKLHNHGRSEIMYVQEFNSYPFMAPWPWQTNPPLSIPGQGSEYCLGWPKFYSILQSAGVKGAGSKMTTWGIRYYGEPVNDIWEGCFCPSMDAVDILKTANHAGNFDYGGNWMYWTSYYPWAIGYQWSPYLRAQYPRGRYPPELIDYEPDAYRWQWVSHDVPLPGGTYCTQAVRPDELEDPSAKAEAWDSWDVLSAPRMEWWARKRNMGAWTPGWHAGVANLKGRPVFNALRHQGSPNILYADGHVACDAKRPIVPSDGLTYMLGDLKAVTYDEWDDTFGGYRRLIPRCQFGQ